MRGFCRVIKIDLCGPEKTRIAPAAHLLKRGAQSPQDTEYIVYIHEECAIRVPSATARTSPAFKLLRQADSKPRGGIRPHHL